MHKKPEDLTTHCSFSHNKPNENRISLNIPLSNLKVWGKLYILKGFHNSSINHNNILQLKNKKIATKADNSTQHQNNSIQPNRGTTVTASITTTTIQTTIENPLNSTQTKNKLKLKKKIQRSICSKLTSFLYERAKSESTIAQSIAKTKNPNPFLLTAAHKYKKIEKTNKLSRFFKTRKP